ncbi:MAG TPA: hypothetical protein VN033_12300 [Vulgatibacter sp.]|nr:hypothetical protein [Vulgatibacter sp.]
MRTFLNIALIGAAAALVAPLGASAQTAGSLLDEARATLATMKNSAAEVRKMAEGTKDSDRIKFDCVNESYQAMEQDLQLAEATIEAAVGWGPDVADAALKSVRGTQQQFNEHRVTANRCVGLADDEGVVEVGEESTIAATDDAVTDDDEERDQPGAFDPFAAGGTTPTGSIPLTARAPAASPTK